MNDYMIRAIGAGGQVRAFAAYTRNTVETARAAHNSSPIVTAALGRLMTGALMMGSMMKGDKDVLTLRIDGDGPIKRLLVTADSKGNVKGYPGRSDVVLPANALGKLDIAGAIGKGFLTVTKDIGLKEPYNGTCELISGEIAEDLTYYFASSEQTPSGVGLGVLMTADNTVDVAGGFIVQIMPGATEETISAVETGFSQITSVTNLFKEGKTPEDIVRIALNGLDVEIFDIMPVQFKCDCSMEKVKRAISLISDDERQKLAQEGRPIEVKCEFCNRTYNIPPIDLIT